MSGAKEILGHGWEFPIKLNRSQKVDDDEFGSSIDSAYPIGISVASHEEKIMQSILIILGTAKGERVMRPDFGCDIHDHIFDIIDTTTLTQVKTAVKNALILWEPRIEVMSVETTTEMLYEGLIHIHLDYRVRYTNTAHNLVYPFYLDSHESLL